MCNVIFLVRRYEQSISKFEIICSILLIKKKHFSKQNMLYQHRKCERYFCPHVQLLPQTPSKSKQQRCSDLHVPRSPKSKKMVFETWSVWHQDIAKTHNRNKLKIEAWLMNDIQTFTRACCENCIQGSMKMKKKQHFQEFLFTFITPR